MNVPGCWSVICLNHLWKVGFFSFRKKAYFIRFTFFFFLSMVFFNLLFLDLILHSTISSNLIFQDKARQRWLLMTANNHPCWHEMKQSEKTALTLFNLPSFLSTWHRRQNESCVFFFFFCFYCAVTIVIRRVMQQMKTFQECVVRRWTQPLRGLLSERLAVAVVAS